MTCSPGVVPGESNTYPIVPVKQPLLNCSSTVFFIVLGFVLILVRPNRRVLLLVQRGVFKKENWSHNRTAANESKYSSKKEDDCE